jgi:hypothetical protein
MVRSIGLSLTAALILSACHKWVTVESPDLVLQEQVEEPVNDRDLLRLSFDESDASIEGTLQSLGPDSLVIVKRGSQATVPRATISEVAVRRGDPAGTAATVLGSIVGGVLLLGAIVAASCDPNSLVC